MAGLALSGLASGVDTSSIVDQLMAIERQSLSRITLAKSRALARQTALNDITAKLSALKSAAADLRAPTLWSNVQTVSSSDAARVGVERLTDATPGTFNVVVQQLARGTQKTYDYTPSSGAPSDITIGGVTVTVAANASLDEVVAAINANSTVPVYAAKSGTQLVLSSKTTGATASDFAVSGSPYAEDTTKLVAGRNARYTLDGLQRTSATNVVEDAIPGTKLTLKAVAATAVAITVTAPALDQEKVKAKLKTFIEAYNAVVQTTREKVTERRDPKATLQSAQTKGELFGDSGLTSLLSKLRIAATDTVAGNPATSDDLLDLGISTGKSTAGASTPDAVAGKLTLDEATLASVLSGDAGAVQRFMGGLSGVAGFAQRIEGIVSQQVGTGALLDGRVKAADSEIRRFDVQYADSERRLGIKEKRLKAQFAAMESALQASQTQQSWLAGQLTAFNRPA